MKTTRRINTYLVIALISGSLAAGLRAADAPAADAAALKARLETLGKKAEETDFSAQYGAYYLNAAPDAEIAKMKTENRLAREELVVLAPANAAYRIALGNLYVREGAADKAAAAFKAALDLPGLSPVQQGEALTGTASAALLKGDRGAALKACEDLVARQLNTTSRGQPDPVIQATMALDLMTGPDLDYLKLPYYTGAKAFPTPQQAVYQETFVPLTAVAVVLGKDIKPDDVRLGLLKTKFARFGITFADKAPFTIRIDTEAAPKAPEKSEGYALTVTKDGAIINGHDAQGTLWGIVSLIQLVDREKAPKIRIAEILDYPDTAVRGFLQDINWGHAPEYMLFCKMNTVVAQRGPQITHQNPLTAWTPLEKEICKELSETYTAFGIRHYFGIVAWTMWYKEPLSSARTFELHRNLCAELARHGGNVYFPYDDGRFPLPQSDLEKYGSAAAIDATYLTRLFRAVRKESPGFQMIFCPPFYWGPDSAAAYPEPREPYLKSLATELDPAIDVFWTGPRVKGYEKTKAQVQWFTDMTGHKPMIFQNGTGPHNTVSYITDETPGWTAWHYDGFFENDIAGFLKNSHMGTEAPQTTTLADCLWNVKAYDAAASIRRGVAMLFGKEMFDLIDPANQALAYLDKYPYGQVTPEAVTEIPEIERRVAIADAAYNKGLAYNAFSLKNFPGWLGAAVGWYKQCVVAAKKAPDFYSKYTREIEETKTLAAKEVGLDAAKGDLFKSPLDFLGGTLGMYDNKCPKRFANWIYGKGTTVSTLKVNFECDPFPSAGDYLFYLCAQDGDAETPCKIRIAVNGKTLFEGPNTFVRHGWSVEKFTIPFDCLKRANVLTVENIEDTDKTNGPPWFMVSYGVLKKAVQ